MLLINDIHVSKDNISEFHKNWDEALRICKERDIQDIVIGGDLWQSRAAQTLNTLLAVRSALMKAHLQGVCLTIASGNHDLVDQESLMGYNHVFSEYPDVFVVDDYVEMPFGDEDNVLWIMSYFPENGTFPIRLEELKAGLNSSERNFLYCHEGINGALSTSSDKELSAQIFGGFEKVFVGHYHNRASLNNGQIEYIGSSRQHNFGEDAEKGYTILFSDGSTEFVKNQANTQFATIEVDVKHLKEAQEQIKALSDKSVKVRLKVTGKSDELNAIDRDALIELGVTKIEVEAEETNSYSSSQDFDSKYDKAGLKEEYSKFCLQKQIDNVEMGLQYLDKIS